MTGVTRDRSGEDLAATIEEMASRTDGSLDPPTRLSGREQSFVRGAIVEGLRLLTMLEGGIKEWRLRQAVKSARSQLILADATLADAARRAANREPAPPDDGAG